MEVSLHIYRCLSMISARSVMATKGRHARSTLSPTLSILVGPWVYLGVLFVATEYQDLALGKTESSSFGCIGGAYPWS